MPTEGVQNRTFKGLFSGTVRFEIPFFQRGYAWEKKQWDQLFLDLQEQIIGELSSGYTIDQVEHFFGPIVVLEIAGDEAALKQFLVIDGQQRIVTVYSFLGLSENPWRPRSICRSKPSDTWPGDVPCAVETQRQLGSRLRNHL